jgi:hypothetical protein
LLYAGAALVAALLAVVVATGLGGEPSQSTAQKAPSPETLPLRPAEMERVVAAYYAALPDQPTAAWDRLGPRLRAGDRDAFESRWGQVTTLAVTSTPHTTGKDTVQVGIRMRLRDGATVIESHRHGMVRLDGRVLIGSDTVVNHQRSEPPQRNDHGKHKDDKHDNRHGNDDKGHGKKDKHDKKGGDDKKGKHDHDD